MTNAYEERCASDMFNMHDLLTRIYGPVVIGSPLWCRIVKEQKEWIDALFDNHISALNRLHQFNYTATVLEEYQLLYS